MHFYVERDEIYSARVALFNEQRGRCVICDKQTDLLQVDHCHSSLVIRGLLCGRCNTGLGMFRDSIDNLLAAITYLQRSAELVASVTEDDRARVRPRLIEIQTAAQRKRARAYSESDFSGS